MKDFLKLEQLNSLRRNEKKDNWYLEDFLLIY
jgi:hypothetical protein